MNIRKYMHNYKKYAKKIKKCEKCAAYEKAAEELFEKEDLVRDDLHERGENK